MVGILLFPSIALLINSWALLSAPFVMYLLVRALVNKEDIYLEENFGQEYLSYITQGSGHSSLWLDKEEHITRKYSGQLTATADLHVGRRLT